MISFSYFAHKNIRGSIAVKRIKLSWEHSMALAFSIYNRFAHDQKTVVIPRNIFLMCDIA